VYNIAFSPDGKLLASIVGGDDTVHLWDIEGQEQVGVLKGRDASGGWSDEVAFSPVGKWLACGGENGVELWEVNLPGAAPRTSAFGPKPTDGTLHTDTWVNLEWLAGDFAASHYVYLGDNFEDVNTGTESTFQGNQLETFLRAGFPGSAYSDGLVRGSTYYWRIDEVNDTEPNSPWKGPVWSFTIQPKVAYNPNPADGAEFVDLNVELGWTAGFGAALHTVYFGDDFDDVNIATKGLEQVAITYTPGPLQFGKTYYWRVDELTGGRNSGVNKGNVWNFTTADFLIVDNFEDYDAGNNKIWWSWKDGLGYASYDNEPAYSGNRTGSAVGDEMTQSYTEETIVHGDNQSIPLAYDNNKQGYLNYSEAEMTLSDLRNWTVEGMRVLTIWYHGAASNSAEPMYVVLNGNAVVTHDNPNAAQIETWTRWDIDLQEFSELGIDLTNVHTIGLGFGDRNNPQPGGSGKMYFDDIRLCR
jgi:WD40 repeat protein